MSGLSRTPGKRVWVNSPPRVRIPLPPPDYLVMTTGSAPYPSFYPTSITAAARAVKPPIGPWRNHSTASARRMSAPASVNHARAVADLRAPASIAKTSDSGP